MTWTFDKENFRVVFRAVLASVSLLFVFYYVYKITFVPEGLEVSKYGDFILGFLLGTLLNTAFNYYFSGTEDKEKELPSDDSLPAIPVIEEIDEINTP